MFKETVAQGDDLLVEELWDAPKAVLCAMAQEATGKHILILSGGTRECRLFDDFTFFSKENTVEFPAWETLPCEEIPPSPDIVGERHRFLHDIVQNSEPKIVLATLQSCLQKVVPPHTMRRLQFSLSVGENMPLELVIGQLAESGYQRVPVAADKGEYAVRGGIVDVFPVSTPDPYRIEFFDEDVESIRIYDPVSQKSVRKEGHVDIPPADEFKLVNESGELVTLLDYLGNETLIVFDDLLALEDRWVSIKGTLTKASKHFLSFEEFLDAAGGYQKLYLPTTPIEELSDAVQIEQGVGAYYSRRVALQKIEFEIFGKKLAAKRWNHPFIPVADAFPDASGQGDLLQGIGKAVRSSRKCDIVIIANTPSEEKHFKERLEEADIVLPDTTEYVRGYLSSGFYLMDTDFVLLPMTEMTHHYKVRRQKMRSAYHFTPSEAFDITPGEYVVHYANGIGKFLGVERLPDHNGIESEFLKIEYANAGKLYVPLTQSNLISKYVGAKEDVPALHTIGSTRWQNTRKRTERAIMGYATQLLEMHAQRELQGGCEYPSDSVEYKQYEREFPYIESEDQLAAINLVNKDMCSQKAMDRLVCGDVGYGKTEVAMRAACKAVIDGNKQVAVLVPTTVLALQHYETFSERMENYPVTIRQLSRFVSAKETKETLRGIEEGSVDIVIGTHRIVSKDVKFKNLGLVVIDEEQRFGVRAKEHLKAIRAGVDCLTLSATPIPRTLHMSLVGVRDLSIINTPPQDRLPIKTIIAENDDELIKNALLRELARDGQSFIIHNRVETIFDFATKIKELLPHAKIVVGHGQMSAEEIDAIFHAFKNGQADILIATTIVENGIDIPNANTILIDRADRFGLSDLYQLRGRVGRWNRRAYAYFLTPKGMVLSELSRKRLSALVEAGGYGGGMKVAMRDLEIRGAGDILGIEQSGHVSSVGFHLYCKMLKRTIKALTGKLPNVAYDTRVEFPIDARLPEEYVNETQLRMEIYQRLGEALSFDEADAVFDEIKDRFGPLPTPAIWLYHFTRIRIFAQRHFFLKLKMERVSLTAERTVGEQTIVKQFLLPKPKNPQHFEQTVITSLQQEFNLID
ncbi:transcription-repair coupling factor [Simkania negevensis]|uniref:Transcription-repair-coupling factor n=1 Tax=Simkania negevensis TaxID=83561 RepID=A0ABS3AR44_9BACT|nr:transcription-repair coupling factor [Simkania negevensis]